VADYSIVFTRSARKELESLDMRVALRVLRRIESLAQNPRPSGVVKFRVPMTYGGNWRVIYRVADGENLVDVIAVRHRSDAYR
jgi:mRNA interferase RelE/StbE